MANVHSPGSVRGTAFGVVEHLIVNCRTVFVALLTGVVCSMCTLKSDFNYAVVYKSLELLALAWVS